MLTETQKQAADTMRAELGKLSGIPIFEYVKFEEYSSALIGFGGIGESPSGESVGEILRISGTNIYLLLMINGKEIIGKMWFYSLGLNRFGWPKMKFQDVFEHKELTAKQKEHIIFNLDWFGR
jgi:hypothetical protein